MKFSKKKKNGEDRSYHRKKKKNFCPKNKKKHKRISEQLITHPAIPNTRNPTQNICNTHKALIDTFCMCLYRIHCKKAKNDQLIQKKKTFQSIIRDKLGYVKNLGFCS